VQAAEPEQRGGGESASGSSGGGFSEHCSCVICCLEAGSWKRNIVKVRQVRARVRRRGRGNHRFLRSSAELQAACQWREMWLLSTFQASM
jgi:hypothetical protein